MNQNIQIVMFVVNLVLAGIVGALSAFFTIGQYKNKVDNLETTLGKDEHAGLRKTVGEIRDKVVTCEATMKANEPLVKRKSPVSLTDRGTSLLEMSGGKKFVDDNLESLKLAVETKGAKTAYDIQEFSREALELMSEQDLFNPLKDYLFKEGLELKDLILVMGIYLRDAILSSKGLAPEEVDKTDPNHNATANG